VGDGLEKAGALIETRMVDTPQRGCAAATRAARRCGSLVIYAPRSAFNDRAAAGAACRRAGVC